MDLCVALANASWGEGRDLSDIGVITEGNHADLAIIDRDPIACPIEELRNIKVHKTLFGGKTVYDSGSR